MSRQRFFPAPQVGITFIPNSPRWLVLRSLRSSSLLEADQVSCGRCGSLLSSKVLFLKFQDVPSTAMLKDVFFLSMLKLIMLDIIYRNLFYHFLD